MTDLYKQYAKNKQHKVKVAGTVAPPKPKPAPIDKLRGTPPTAAARRNTPVTSASDPNAVAARQRKNSPARNRADVYQGVMDEDPLG